MKRRTRGTVFPAALIVLIAWCAPAGAGWAGIYQTWDGSEGTAWGTPGNWSGNQAPASDDRLTIGDAASGNQPTASSDVTVDGAGYIKVAGTGAEATFDDDLRIDSTGDGAGTSGFHALAGGVVQSDRGYLGYRSGSVGTATVTGKGSLWEVDYSLTVGNSGAGSLTISDGGVVKSVGGCFGFWPGSKGTATVTGAGSMWEMPGDFAVGYKGAGTLTISGGGVFKSGDVYLGFQSSGSVGTATVTGKGSVWNVDDILYVGGEGTGTLTIANGGLVSVGGTLTIDFNGGNDSFINMYGYTGGMLALKGQADASLQAFLDLIDGTDAIRYWDGSAWAAITGATLGTDYTLEYIPDTTKLALSTGTGLEGYTVLTVLPEPATLALMAAGIVGLAARRRRGR